MSEYVINHPGEIIYNQETGYYLDQLCDSEEYWVEKSQMKYYIEYNYGLTLEQYYNLVVNNDKDKIKLCPQCGSKIPFRSLLRPYSSVCNNCKQVNKKKLSRSDYIDSQLLPKDITDDELDEYKENRLKFMRKIIKFSGRSTDEIVKLIKRKRYIYMSDISELVNRDKLNSRYLNKTNLREFLRTKGYLDEEITNLIYEDRSTGKTDINFSTYD